MDNKRNKTQGNDRLTDLPHSLLQHVLSFLPTKQVVQTCVLSKSWEKLWRSSLPSIDLDQRLFRVPDHFEQFGNSLLSLLDDGCSIQKLGVLCGDWSNVLRNGRPNDGKSEHINSWIISAMQHNVEHLELQIAVPRSFKLTNQLLGCATLRVLKVTSNSTRLNFPTSICLPMLQILHLEKVVFPDKERTMSLFTKCPLLETLSLYWCRFGRRLNCLEIFALQLRNLTIMGDICKLITTISAPNIVSLNLGLRSSLGIRSGLQPGDFCFTDTLVSLEEAHLCLSTSPNLSTDFLKVVQNVQSLSLSQIFLECIAYHLLKEKDGHVIRCMQVCFPNLKKLKLETWYYNAQMILINTLLKDNPNVETLVLAKSKDNVTINRLSTAMHSEEDMWFEYMLPCLRLVQIGKSEGDINEVKMVEFLLEHAVALEKLVIVAIKPARMSFEDRRMQTRILKEKLLTHQHASASVEISLIDDF